MRKILLVLTVLMLVMAAGCSNEPKIDGSSEEALKTSINAITEKMEDAKKEEFGKAMSTIAFASVDFKSMIKDISAGKEPNMNAVMKEMDGMTADEVIEHAKEIVEARKDKE